MAQAGGCPLLWAAAPAPPNQTRFGAIVPGRQCLSAQGFDLSSIQAVRSTHAAVRCATGELEVEEGEVAALLACPAYEARAAGLRCLARLVGGGRSAPPWLHGMLLSHMAVEPHHKALRRTLQLVAALPAPERCNQELSCCWACMMTVAVVELKCAWSACGKGRHMCGHHGLRMSSFVHAGSKKVVPGKRCWPCCERHATRTCGNWPSSALLQLCGPCCGTPLQRPRLRSMPRMLSPGRRWWKPCSSAAKPHCPPACASLQSRPSLPQVNGFYSP